ncbi:hypothetical protein REJC140_04149 [Pseudorhizobium endolithicum]|uniref:DUF2087 domain-containing protein n=1 Tax=Pseudorhizobium endolithicum TaxID=1191678 RepID=A0ABN7JWJ7_9HYPH|nr:DUF2087 domain-containing protein [Pseudorhizobium endolithicum]CAD7046873.1 hypothetical protein REJC140_04149 [Pseudorhizobium endolithicum]
MTRTIFPMEVADISAFARALREQIGRLDHKPSHVEMLNLLSRAGGYRNFQHFRSTLKTAETLQEWRLEDDAPPAADEARVKRTLRVFDAEGRILRWPGKRSQQELCLWFLWSKIPAGQHFSEREMGVFLNTLHLFQDPALLRRDLVDLSLMRRNRDGSDYHRVEREPPPELGLLLRLLKEDRQKAV